MAKCSKFAVAINWRDGRAAEGAPLLREYGLTPIEGSNPSLSAILACTCKELNHSAPVAQLDRVPGYEPGGREFESLRARHIIKGLSDFLL